MDERTVGVRLPAVGVRWMRGSAHAPPGLVRLVLPGQCAVQGGLWGWVSGPRGRQRSRSKGERGIGVPHDLVLFGVAQEDGLWGKGKGRGKQEGERTEEERGEHRQWEGEERRLMWVVEHTCEDEAVSDVAARADHRRHLDAVRRQ